MDAVTWETFHDCLLQGRLQACHAFLDGEHAAESGTPRYWAGRANTYYRASEFTQALDLCLKIGNDFPGYINHRYLLTDVCAHLGLAELGRAELARMAGRANLHPGIEAQIFAEGWAPLGLDKEILALEPGNSCGDLNHHVRLMMAAQSQMRLHGIASGLSAYQESYCTPAAWNCMYPQFDTSNYWSGQKELPQVLKLESRGGIGDQLQWVRYAAILACAGVHVELNDWNPDVLRLLPADRDGFAPLLAERGYHLGHSDAPMWSDPFTLFSALFPDFGYAARSRYVSRSSACQETELLNQIRANAGDKPCVGLFWSANESPTTFGGRSLKLQQLHELLAMPDVHWVIFQRGYQRTRWLEDARSRDTEHFTTLPLSLSFNGSIALAGELDALVSIDSGLLHGAAAMGTPAILLANHAAEWRWEKHPTASPWYPGMFIARAPLLGAWEEAAGIARDALRRQLSDPTHTALPLAPGA
jgi:hypothetical protein